MNAENTLQSIDQPNIDTVNTTNNTADITVRRMDFDLDPDIPTLWFGDHRLLTMLLTALSGVFPEGERMFMRSVRHYEKNIQDPELRKQVKAFIGQEAHHGKEHHAFNEFMESKGVPVMAIDKFTKDGIQWEESMFPPKVLLARTCALEHFTAIFAETLLQNPHLIDAMDDRMKPIWIWHAIEESEHKSVAFDVYQDQVDDYRNRVIQMLSTTVFFTFFTAYHTNTLLKKTAESTPRKGQKLVNWREIWKHRDILKNMGKDYLAYYKRDFHPNQKPAQNLRDKGLKLLSRYTGRTDLDQSLLNSAQTGA